TRSPRLPVAEKEEFDLIAGLLGNAMMQVPEDVARQAAEFNSEQLKQLEGDERLTYVLEHLKRRGLVPQDYSLDLARRKLDVIRNNRQSANQYLPDTPYRGDAVLFTAVGTAPDNAPRWKEFISGSMEAVPVSGQHAQLLDNPFVAEIAAHIQIYVEKSRKQSLSAKSSA